MVLGYFEGGLDGFEGVFEGGFEGVFEGSFEGGYERDFQKYYFINPICIYLAT